MLQPCEEKGRGTEGFALVEVGGVDGQRSGLFFWGWRHVGLQGQLKEQRNGTSI